MFALIYIFLWARLNLLQLPSEDVMMSIPAATLPMVVSWTLSTRACRAQKGTH